MTKSKEAEIKKLQAEVDRLLSNITELAESGEGVPKPKAKKRRRKAGTVAPDAGGRHASPGSGGKLTDPQKLRELAAQLRAQGRFREATSAVYHALMIEQGQLKKRR